jgi:carbon-monoxide dehydrogenase medium subunit
MKPARFDYHAPTSIEEATELLARLGEDSKVIAGGQSLVPAMNMRLAQTSNLVDVNGIDALAAVDHGDAWVAIGATVRQCDIEAGVAEGIPLLADATPLIGHFQIRSRGTLGGSIAHADPAGEYPAIAVCLDAMVDLATASGSRSVQASQFFRGVWQTDASSDELVTAVRFPRWRPGARFAIEEVARRHGDFALAGAVVAVELDGDVVRRAAVALFAVDATPLRRSDVERELVGAHIGDLDLHEVGRAAVDGLEPSDDLNAPAELKRRIAATVTERALSRVLASV